MRPKRVLGMLLLLSAQLLFAQAPATNPAPTELEYPHIPKLLTPRIAIHADEGPEPVGPALTPIQKAMSAQDRIFDNMVSITLDVVINQNGRIESAHAISGPQRFYAQAEEIEMHRAYSPARVEGNVVRARFQDYVAVYPQERWSPQAVLFPAKPDLASLSIALERTGCLGSCPSYTVSITGTGDVTFTSGDGSFVAVPGTHHAHIAPDAVRDLLDRFRSANFLAALDSYTCNWTDLPSQTLTLSINGLNKKVVDYGGSVVGLPDAVEQLESLVDRIAGTERWTNGNAETLPSLQAEHWDFAGVSAQNTTLFNAAIQRGNSDLIHAFLSAKAPIVSVDLKLVSPLCTASGTGNRDLVQQMLAIHPKAKLTTGTMDECLSLGAQSGSVPVVQLWLSRGARTTLPPAPPEDTDDDASNFRRRINPPLMAAVQSGNPDVVDLLLHAHADVSPVANRGHSLLSTALNESRIQDDDGKLSRLLSVLIAAGADVNEETEYDRPAIFDADSHPAVISMLLQAGANINQRDSEGKTPLIVSAFSEDSVRTFLQAGADPTLTAADGTTALSRAKQANCTACINLIEVALRERESRRTSPPTVP